MALPTTLTNVTTRKLGSTLNNLWTKIKATFFKPNSGTTTLASNSAVTIGTLNGEDVKLKLPTIPAAANNGALQLQLNGGTATSKFTANQSGNSTLAFASGTTAGTIKVDSTEVAVAGWSGKSDTSHTHTLSLASDTGTSSISLAPNTKYKLTAGGSTYIFTTPAYSNYLGNTGNVSGNNTATYPWRRIAYTGVVTGNYNDKEAIILIHQKYHSGRWGILRITQRTDNLSDGANGGARAEWLVRNGFTLDSVKVAIYKVTGTMRTDIFMNVGSYPRASYSLITPNNGWTFYSSDEGASAASHSNAYTTIDAAATELYSTAYTSVSNSVDCGTVATAVSSTSATTASYPDGFNSRRTSWSWGTLTTANGYTQLTDWHTTNGSDISFAEKSGAVSVQIDGKFYQNTGANAVLDTSDVSNSAPTLAWNTTSTIGTIGGTALTVKLPANPNTDTKVTSSANHYTPSTASGQDKTASASGATAAWSIDVVKGVTLNTDGKGHVTGLSVTSGKIPANPNTDTKVTSAANHYAPETVSGQDKTASASGATAAWSIDVVKGVTLNTDGKGHVTGLSVTSGKIPGNPNTDTKVKATAKTDNVNYKILATASASPTSGNATEAVYDADISLNPSTNTISANISGNAATATTATNANITRTADTANGDKLQIGTGSAVNITNAKHAASADTATSADLTRTQNPSNPYEGDQIQIGTGTAITLKNAMYAYRIGYSESSDNAVGNSTTPICIDSDGFPVSCGFTVGKSVPSNAVFTDTKVTQTADNSSTGTGFELLFSATADNTTRTETSRKSNKLTFQPSTGTLTATKFSGPLTGNVTGNCSGSSGSCTGNAATATTATNANITRTADTTNGDKLQIGTGTAVNITNAKHAASADSASKVANKLTLKIKTGSTEGTNLYTYDGSAAKTLDIKQGSNITLTAAAGSLTIAGTDTKNTVGVGPVTHTYDASYYVPFTSSSPTSASNAQSYTNMSGEGYSNTALLSFADDPVKGMQGFITGNLIGRFNGVPPETADGKLITVGMDGQLIVSSILETDVALSSNVEPLLTVSRRVIKSGRTGIWDEAAPEPNGEILGFNCSRRASNNRDGFGIAFNVNGRMTGGLTFTETVNGTKSTSYILVYSNGAITGGKKFHFYGSSDYAITAGTANTAALAGSAVNVALAGSVKTTSTSNGDTIQFQAGSGTAGTVTIVNAKHAASADSATSASYLTDATNTSRTAKVAYYSSGTISGSNSVQYLAGFYTPDGSSSSTICDVPHAKMLMYIFDQLYSSRCQTINSNHTLSLSDFSNNANGSLYMYQNVTGSSKTLTWTYRHTQGLGTATGTVEKGCTAVFILDDANNAIFTRLM